MFSTHPSQYFACIDRLRYFGIPQTLGFTVYEIRGEQDQRQYDDDDPMHTPRTAKGPCLFPIEARSLFQEQIQACRYAHWGQGRRAISQKEDEAAGIVPSLFTFRHYSIDPLTVCSIIEYVLIKTPAHEFEFQERHFVEFKKILSA